MSLRQKLGKAIIQTQSQAARAAPNQAAIVNYTQQSKLFQE